MYQSQGQWDNRMHLAVHRASADLRGTNRHGPYTHQVPISI
jgi:hypothetical protein